MVERCPALRARRFRFDGQDSQPLSNRPKFSPKHANSHHPDSGHRLAGYVNNPETIHMTERSPCRGMGARHDNRGARYTAK